MTHAVSIIGVLDDGIDSLSARALLHIQQSDLIIGGSRTLKLFADQFKTGAITHDLTGKLGVIPEWVLQAGQDKLKVSILATGDPLCHGIAKYVMSKVPELRFDIVPNVSTIQLAFARLGIPWQQAVIRSIHSKDAGEWQTGADAKHGLYTLLQDIQQNDLLAVFTSEENSPARVARMLLQEQLENDVRLSVVENLLCAEERVLANLSIQDAAETVFASPNILIIERLSPRSPVLFGHEDLEYAQRKPEKGLITKREVRAVSLAHMQLTKNSIVWDIGAGSGSVGLEAAQLASRGHVYAIEKNSADLDIIETNRRRFGLTNYSVISGKAPEHLDHWPDPDAVFVGGSGGELSVLIETILERLNTGGKLVMNFVTIENFSDAINYLKQRNANWSVTQLQVARSQPILHMNRLAAENPVWIVTVTKPEQNESTETA